MRTFPIAASGLLAIASMIGCSQNEGVERSFVPADRAERYVNDMPEELIDDRAEFLDAWARDDVDATLAAFTDNVMLDDGMTAMRGSDEVRGWLMMQLPDVLDLRVEQHDFVRSEEEILERGRYTVVVDTGGGMTDTRSGDYEIQWQFEGDDYLIEEIDLDPDQP